MIKAVLSGKSPSDESDATVQRYERALRLTAPKVAAETPGLGVEGYWLDNNRFYFLAERFEPSLGRVVATPSIADGQGQHVEEVMPLAVLASLLSDSAGQPVDFLALSCAQFDMPDRDRLAVSVGGQDYLIDVRRRSIVEARASLGVPALYSPDGCYACFVKGHDLWLKERATGAERPLTTDGALHYSYGQQTESCSSAISYRKRPVPMGLWSPDSRWFLTHRIDERSLPELALIQHAPPGGGRPVLHAYKYPMPGDPLPVATYVAIHVASGRMVTFEEFPVLVLGYSPFSWRTAWFGAENTVWFVRQDRYFKQAELIRLNPEQGIGHIALSETVAHGYLEFHQLLGVTPNVRTLAGSSEVIWFSERDGWGHLYLYDAATGAVKNRITRGEWLVRDIIHIDERERRLVFTACGIDPQRDPARRTLCAVNLDGSGFEVLLAHDGDITLPRTEPCGVGQDRPFRPAYAQPGLSPGGHFGVVRYASVERGNKSELIEFHTRRGFGIASALPAAGEMLPRAFSALAADGVTRLHGVLFYPSDFDESRRYPLIDYIYPGPQSLQQPQSFGPSGAFARALAELGFITFMLDTRGIPFRSRALHQIGYGDLLEPQLADHAAVVRQLSQRLQYIDGDRVGMIGQSGGGLATARSLFDYGHLFKVGVSVCGNHDSSVYTTFWSDKYRGPGDRESFARQANSSAAHKLNGELLLISGDMDENVHVSHTLRLVDALVCANRDFELLIVPNEGHPVLMTSGYAQRRTWDYFVRHLLLQTPPRNFAIKFEPHELKRLDECLTREHRS